MYCIKNAKPQQRRSLELLENRMLFNGNVTAEIRSGDLLIRGDAADNAIEITQLESGAMRIAGEDDTTINGQEFVELTGLTDDMSVQMQQGGTDDVEIQGALSVPDDLSIHIGSGDVLVEGSFGPVDVGDDLSVRTGSRGHSIIRNDVRIAGDAYIKAGEADVVSGKATQPDYASAVFGNSTTIDNAYFPLVPGTIWTYETEEIDEDTGDVLIESIVVEVLNETRIVDGVEVRIVRDRVSVDGLVVEDTFDWYAQDNNGNVWYFGEEVTNFEYDDEGNLISSDSEGSWTAGEEGALPGINMEANPRVGHTYFQEFAPGNVLDQAVGLATDETLTTAIGTFNNVFRTEETTVIEPFAFANKLYAPGLGTVGELDIDIEDDEIEKTTRLLSVTLNGQAVTQLVSPIFDGINAEGTVIGGADIGGNTTIRANRSVALRGIEVDQLLNVRCKDQLVVFDSTLGGNASFSTIDSLAFRRVIGEANVRSEDAGDVHIFDSDMFRFKGLFGRAGNDLIVKGSTFDEFYADGGRGGNTFDDQGDNTFGKLTLKHFVVDG